MSVPSGSENGGITWGDCYLAGTGESGYIAVHPARPEHRLRRRGRQLAGRRQRAAALRPPHAPDPAHHHLAGGLRRLGRQGPQVPLRLDLPDRLLAARPRHALRAGNLVFRTPDEGQSWEAISPDLTRPTRPSSRRPAARSRGHDRRRELRHRLRLRRVPARARRPLGRHRRRPRPRLPRRRPELAERDAARSAGVDADRHDRALAPRARARSTSPPPATSSTTTRAYLYKTEDYGQTWRALAAGIPADDISRVIREDPGPARAALRRDGDRGHDLLGRRARRGTGVPGTCR